jgi:alanine racemase
MSNYARSRAWVDVDLDALRENYLTVRRGGGRGTGDRPVVAMVKADAYGIGVQRVVRTLEPLQPLAYGVAAAAEGAFLRTLGIERPIFVMGPLAPQAVEQAAVARLTASISDVEGLERWAAAAERLGIPLDLHVEIDTGMGRAGFDWRTVGDWGPAVRGRLGPGLRWTGVFTHFHGADAASRVPTTTQWERFRDAVAQLPVPREDLLVHVSNSAAALRFPEMAVDAVRPGIFLYGGHPLAGSGAEHEVPAPRPVAALRARVVLVRDAAPGSTVGYGATHTSARWERWATLAIGYGDGYPRRLGNRGHALVHGVRVPVVGRISMDMTVVDVSAVPDVREGDVATLFGRDGEAAILLDEVAAQAETIGYEILTGLTPRLPRVEAEAEHAG